MKIPVQEKIAELERRIASLEASRQREWDRAMQYSQAQVSVSTMPAVSTPLNIGHWKAMWHHFGKLFD